MTRHFEQNAPAFDADAHLKSLTSLDWADSVEGSTEKVDIPAAEPRTEPEAAAPQADAPHASTSEPEPQLVANTPAAVDVVERRRPSAVTLVVLCAAFAAVIFTGTRMFGGSADKSPTDEAATPDGEADGQPRDRLAALNVEIAGREKVLADLQRRIDDKSAALEAPYETALVAESPDRAAPAARAQGAVSQRDTIPEDLPPDEMPSRTGPAVGPPQKAPAHGAAPAPRISADAPSASSSTAGVRVFIHVPVGVAGALARARAIAAELARDGVAVADIRSVPHAVRRDAVRYFYDADRAALGTVERAVRDTSPPGGQPPAAQDFRGYAAPPRPGTLEIWLS
jgi:hypothetical protein